MIMNNIKTTIRQIVEKHGRLSINVGTLEEDSSLYDSGLTSLATVGLMLALENHFNVEFTDEMLSRRTFQSIESISAAIIKLSLTDTARISPERIL